jgi:hypothetical protein
MSAGLVVPNGEESHFDMALLYQVAAMKAFAFHAERSSVQGSMVKLDSRQPVPLIRDRGQPDQEQH